MNLRAQDAALDKVDEDKGFISISGGASIPLGMYASVNSNKESSGFAQHGLSMNLISLNYKLHENIGFAAMWTSGTNPLNVDSALNLYIKDDPNYSYKLRSYNYTHGALLAGAYISFPLYDGFKLDFRCMGGYATAAIPEQVITKTDGFSEYIIKLSDDKSNAFGYDIGMMLRYNVDNRLCLTLGFDYFETKQTFTVASDVTKESTVISSELEISKKISLLNIAFGIGLRLK